MCCARERIQGVKLELKTSDKWLEEVERKIRLLDADGWDRGNFEYSFFGEKITKAEFDRRLLDSTVQMEISN